MGDGLQLELRTGSRLHFGLMELAEGQPQRFGGLGLMLDQPGWRLGVTGSQAEHVACPPHASRAEIVSRVQLALQRATREAARGTTAAASPKLSIDVREILPLHHGLGAGTQLACAAAVAVQLFERVASGRLSATHPWTEVAAGLPELTSQELAERAGRGLRSWIGLHGFQHGGFIFDRGQPAAGHAVRSEAEHAACPPDWRVVLVCPSGVPTVAGEQEKSVMDELASSPNPHKQEMTELATAMLRAAAQGLPFDSTMALLEAYLALAARLFAGHQGGEFNGPEVTRAAASAKAAGLRGVGQSSWGPTVFGFAPTHAVAELVVEELRRHAQGWNVAMAKPSQHGAQWRTLDDSLPDSQ